MAIAVEPARAPAPEKRRRRARWLPLSDLEFAGCVTERMTLAEYDAHPEDDRRIEFFDSEFEQAWIAEDGPSPAHEEPGRRLVELAHEIAMVRGAPMAFCGSGQLRVRNPATGAVRAMHPDELIYLDPDRAFRLGRFIRIGRDAWPDVVLEVDITRDTRRDKVKLYEEWGFPELWVEVPDAEYPRRRSGLRPGLRIYLLEEGRFVLSKTSRAFPGWKASEIHRALNEKAITAATTEVLRRVGRVLGDREGTRSEDNPLLGATLAEGRAQGHAEGRVAMARAILKSRHVPVIPAGWSASR